MHEYADWEPLEKLKIPTPKSMSRETCLAPIICTAIRVAFNRRRNMAKPRERLVGLAAGLGLAAVVGAVAARADELPRYELLEENDSLYFHTDKHYTQGLRLSYLAPTVPAGDWWDRPFDYLAANTPIFAAPSTDRRYALFLGQSIFTPENLTLKPPSLRDRPYAGWLYGGVSLLQNSGDRMLENLELDLGVVGPGALGEQVQNDWHQFIGVNQAKGWSDQIQNEPGAMLSYERMWRLPLLDGPFGVDVVPEAGATLGNVMTYGDVGGMLRIGSDLGTDFGPTRVRPALSGTDYFDGDKAAPGLNGYFYVGTQGRVVGRNIFLDGNTFRTSPSVSKKILVADLDSGFVFLWSSRVRIDFSVVRRTEEFYGQRTPDVIGTAALNFAL